MRLTPAEADEIRRRAGPETVSAYLRRVALGADAPDLEARIARIEALCVRLLWIVGRE